MTDKQYIDIAIKISSKAQYPYGAIIVRNDMIIGRSDANTSISKTMYRHAQLIATIELSAKSFYPFGAIVVRHGKIIGKSDDITPTKDTIFTHAELIAIESAVQNIKDSISRGNLHECTLYTSCEPCMMCQEAILSEGISRVVYSATIEDSNKYFCEEFPIHFIDMLKRANSHTKVVPELHRDKAVEVLKNRGRLIFN